MKNQRLDAKQAAAYLGYKNPQTLASQRSKGVGPNYIKLGRRILYDVADLDAYIDARRIKLDA